MRFYSALLSRREEINNENPQRSDCTESEKKVNFPIKQVAYVLLDGELAILLIDLTRVISSI